MGGGCGKVHTFYPYIVVCKGQWGSEIFIIECSSFANGSLANVSLQSVMKVRLPHLCEGLMLLRFHSSITVHSCEYLYLFILLNIFLQIKN